MSERRNEVTAVTGGGGLPVAEGDLAPGTLIGEFRIEKSLGRGGMGTVYGAVHEVIGKRGAVKVLRHDLCTNQEEIARFVQEARAVNRIGHANIVDVFAFGSLPDGRSYLVMEWLVGESLRDRMKRGPLSRSQIYDLMTDVVSALEAAHRAGIVHRDLKPDNVFLVEAQGDRRRAKLLDFGVAKLTTEGKQGWTRMGALIGTPQYIAPEQARGEATHQSDIYALGIMLFELLAGRPPFDAPNMVEIVSLHMMEPPPRLATLVDVPKELDALVDRMLAKEGDDRPTFPEIRSGLAHLVPERAKVPAARPSKRGLVVGLGLGVVVIAGVVAFVIARALQTPEVVAAPPAEPVVKAPDPPKPAPPPAPRIEPPRAPPAPGTLHVATKSPGVVVEIDGADSSKANHDIELAPGKHTVTLYRDGKKIGEQSVDIESGKRRTIEVAPPKPGPVRVRPVEPDVGDGLLAPKR